MEVPGELRESGVLRQDRDRIAEVAAEHDPPDRKAGEDRRDGKQDQRDRHDPGRLVRVVAVPMVVVAVIMPVIVVPMRRRLPEALLAVERVEDQPEAVQRGHERAREHAQVRERPARHRGQVRRLDDQVLGEEAGERRERRVRERADQRHRVGDRHVLPQAAHPAHVLLVMERDDHRAGGEEERRLEERVGVEVEDRRRIGRGAERDRHVAELRQRRVGDHALDVVDH